MYDIFMNANGQWYVADINAEGFHGQPGLWTAKNQYESRAKAVEVAKARNRQSHAHEKEPTMHHTSRYTLWGPQTDSYGTRRWGINDTQRIRGAGAYNISGEGYETRQDAMDELRTLRAEEQSDHEELREA